ncbi:hypothetical protein GCM10010319_14800 [Streptomyces blastmyceticus]|uniref:Uncharacterized protein n=1 Tax=Streptomyces blastmyceticus TaxID=68180 RepID=A0ABN0WJJ6_9ACTN
MGGAHGRAVVSVPHSAGPSVIVVGSDDGCDACVGITRERHHATVRRNWSAVWALEARMSAHWEFAHRAVPQ